MAKLQLFVTNHRQMKMYYIFTKIIINLLPTDPVYNY